MVRWLAAAACLLAWSLPLSSGASAQVKVVASVKPVHALVASVMQDVGEPALLVSGKSSPHSYAMRPSEAAALSNADLVIWVGPLLEGFLQKPLNSLARNATTLRLQDAPGLKKLPAREGGSWGAHEHGHSHGKRKGQPAEEIDPHLWLDPANAKAMIGAIVEALSRKDSANAARYAGNGAALNARIDALDAELAQTLAPHEGKPFVVFHDAYQYFEARYRLNAVGAITVSPEQRPSAKRVAQLRERVRKLGAACVFAEPQFEPSIVETIVEGTRAGKGVLDPEGGNIEPGPDGYFTLMRRLASDFAACFSGA